MYVVANKQVAEKTVSRLLNADEMLVPQICSRIKELSACVNEPTFFLIAGELEGVFPLNIAAYLRSQSQDHTIVLLDKQINESLMYRAAKAGVTKVLDYSKLEDYFALDDVDFEQEDDESSKKSQEASGNISKTNSCISLISPMGGCGVSTIASLLSNFAQLSGLSVGLIAFNSSFSPYQISLNARVQSGLNIHQLSEYGAEELLEQASRVKGKLYVYELKERAEELEIIQLAYEHIFTALSRIHDLLVIDLADVWNDLSACCLKISDRIIVVAEERYYTQQSLLETQGLLDRLQIERSKIFYLINKSKRKQRDQSYLKHLSELLASNNVASVPYADDKLEEYSLLGQLLELCTSEQRFTQGLKLYTQELLSELGLIKDKQVSKSLFGRFKS